jgi:ElaB/YqjD/DUF883 family membrane-anchored ribosome-binding protein
MKHHAHTHTKNPSEHRANLLENAQDLLNATAQVAGEKVTQARERLMTAVNNGKHTLEKVQNQAREGAKATDRMIRANPYRSLTMALGVGALIGFLISRRRRGQEAA